MTKQPCGFTTTIAVLTRLTFLKLQAREIHPHNDILYATQSPVSSQEYIRISKRTLSLPLKLVESRRSQSFWRYASVQEALSGHIRCLPLDCSPTVHQSPTERLESPLQDHPLCSATRYIYSLLRVRVIRPLLHSRKQKTCPCLPRLSRKRKVQSPRSQPR